MFKIFLLSASLLFSSIIYSKTLLEDALIFKIVDQIYSVEDVKKTYHDYLQLKCFFPEEKIGSLIKMPERKFDEEFFKIGKTFTSEQKKVYLQFKTLLKLITYVSAQNVAVNSNLKQVINESYEELKCSKKVFKNETPPDLTQSFEQLLKLHIFLNARYANEESAPGKEISGLSLFVDSVDKQISETLFW